MAKSLMISLFVILIGMFLMTVTLTTAINQCCSYPVKVAQVTPTVAQTASASAAPVVSVTPLVKQPATVTVPKVSVAPVGK